MTDRVRCLKIETVSEGGSSEDVYGGVSEVSVGQDYLDAAGVTLQKLGANAATSDTACRLERIAASDMQLTDPNAGTVQLQTLLTSLSGLAGSHNAVHDPIHFLADGGPGDGFASGAYQVTTFATNTPLPATVTWYTDMNLKTPIYQVSYTYPSNSPLPSSITRTMFNAAGTAIRKFVDAPQYLQNSPLYSAMSRSWS